jgi:cyclic pyranopterin phosphate synthase
MPKRGISQKDRTEILSYEEIYQFIKTASNMGINKVRLTGGEPLIRKDICKLISMIASIPAIKDLALTTNGILLAKYAAKLKKTGLNRVNISLDSLKPERYKKITCGGNISDVLAGIKAAKKAGLSPVKINCVILRGVNDDEKDDFLEFGRENGVEIQFIQKMSLDKSKPALDESHVSTRPPDCRICNRLRLTADGFLKPCLLSDDEINIRNYNYAEAIKEAVARKPKQGNRCLKRPMILIGG